MKYQISLNNGQIAFASSHDVILWARRVYAARGLCSIDTPIREVKK